MSDTTDLVNEITAVLTSVDAYNDRSATDIGAFVKSFCDAGQAIVARVEQGEKQGTPFGVAFWARVNSETADALRKTETDIVSLGAGNLGSGDNPWIVEVACDPELAAEFLESCAKAVFPGENIKVRIRDMRGHIQIISMKPAV